MTRLSWFMSYRPERDYLSQSLRNVFVQEDDDFGITARLAFAVFFEVIEE
jgi:hypothetical protein